MYVYIVINREDGIISIHQSLAGAKRVATLYVNNQIEDARIFDDDDDDDDEGIDINTLRFHTEVLIERHQIGK